jgi:hypothetical protein
MKYLSLVCVEKVVKLRDGVLGLFLLVGRPTLVRACPKLLPIKGPNASEQ